MANNNAILRGGAAAEMSLDELFGAVEQEWQDQALCAQTDPEAFFPEKGGSTREAKRICQACAVRDECLEYALEHDERFGIWGGLSDRERRRLKKQINERFHTDPPKGSKSYAIMRAFQMRLSRMPRPQVKRGEQPR